MSGNVRKRYYGNYVSMDDEDNIAAEKLEELRGWWVLLLRKVITSSSNMNTYILIEILTLSFGSFDRNGDGTISASEFQNALIRMNIYIPSDVSQTNSKLDTL